MDKRSASKARERGAKPVIALARVDGRICLVRAEAAEDLICTACRARIQGEALERRREENRRVPH